MPVSKAFSWPDILPAVLRKLSSAQGKWVCVQPLGTSSLWCPVGSHRIRPSKPVLQPCASELVPSSGNIATMTCHLPCVWSSQRLYCGCVTCSHYEMVIQNKTEQKMDPGLPETRQRQIGASESREIRSVADVLNQELLGSHRKSIIYLWFFILIFIPIVWLLHSNCLLPLSWWECPMGDTVSVGLIGGREREMGGRSACHPQLGGDHQTVARLFQRTMWRLQTNKAKGPNGLSKWGEPPWGYQKGVSYVEDLGTQEDERLEL